MYNNYQKPNNDDRIFFAPFVAPFLLGGIAGAGLVGISRPRPVYVTSPAPYQPYPYQQYPPYPPYRPGGYYNYSSGSYY